MIGISMHSFGQIFKFSKETSKFIDEVETHLAETNEDGEIVTDSITSSFKSLYPSYSSNNQKLIHETFSYFLDKKIGKSESFIPYIRALYHANAHGISSTNLDTLIYIIDVYAKNETSTTTSKIIHAFEHFFINQQLYYNRSNSLYADGGSYKIRFVEAPKEVPMSDEELLGSEEEENEEFEDEFEELENEEINWDDWGTDDYEEEEVDEEESTDDELNEEIIDIGYVEPTFPAKQKAIIEFTNIDLRFVTVYDTTKLYQTSGYLLLDKNLFVGDGGKFDWTVAGLDENVFCTFKKYSFKINNSEVKAEGVTMNYQSKLENKIDGIFHFKSQKKNVHGKTTFPRFMSYKSDAVITDLGKNIKYQGGFTLNGQNIYSKSVTGNKAKLEVYNDGVKKFRAIAQNFIFRDSLIIGEPVKITIYIKNDSIYHNGLRLKYDRKTDELKVFKNKSAFKHSPFVDTYHNMEIQVDALFWNLNDTLVHMSNISAKHQVPAQFVSKEFFRRINYTQVKGLLPFHPIQLFYYFAAKTQQRIFYINDIAEYHRKKGNKRVTESSLRTAAKTLMEQGFVDFNTLSGRITIKPKLIHYVKSSRSKKDYDNILIKSISPDGHNASLNLKNNEIIVRGVDKVNLSDSLSVYFEPKNRLVRIKGDRDFSFDGIIYTANYIFNGKNFSFSYENFNVDMTEIDSIAFQVDDIDTTTGRNKGSKQLNNKLVYSSGILYIDKPTNKSSRKRNPEYPYFDAKQGAYVYFDKDEVLDHAYDKSIYFFIPPFDQDSLSSNNSEAVGFKGKFTSGDIFPEFDQKLVVRPDFSFGFEQKTPPEGYKLYAGNGIFHGTITLDKKGLRGIGKIDFLNSTITSNDFIFYPDSVYSDKADVITKEGTNELCADNVTFPEMSLDQCKMNWYPRKDSLYLQNRKEPFQFYNNTATLDGKAIISNAGMYGSGILNTRGSRTFSNNFHFEKTKYEGRESLFEILTENPSKPALRSEKARVNFDLDSGFAYFSPEIEGFASNEFPFLQYKSSIDKGTWDLNKKEISMEKAKDADISSSYFYSTNKRQDSLNFNAEFAFYDMVSQTLNIGGIPGINVADAYIIPDSNQVVIKENANMEKLDSCVIIIDTTYEYHKLFDGHIKIKSRTSFAGDAKYEYINFAKDTLEIKFNYFKLEQGEISKKDTAYHTVSQGSLKMADSFYIAPKILYTGKAKMIADKRILEFDGYIRVDFDSTSEVQMDHWIPYVNLEGDAEFKIAFDQPKSKRQRTIHAGMFLRSTNRELYTSFLNVKRSEEKDRNVFEASGYLMEDYETGDFIVSTPEVVKGISKKDNYISYNDSLEIVHFGGNMNLIQFPEEQKPTLKIEASAIGENSIKDTSYKMNALLNIHFDYPKHAQDEIASNITNALEVEGTNPCNEPTPVFMNNLASFIGDEKAKEYEDANALEYKPVFDFAKELEKGIVLNNVNLVWSPTYKSWYNRGKIGLSSIDKTDINSYVKAYVEIKHSIRGDVVTLYFQVNENVWYYFNYKDNALFTFSSNDEYNEVITSKSQMEKAVAKGAYYFAPATAFEKQRFITQFKSRYLGIGEADEVEDEFTEDVSDSTGTDEFDEIETNDENEFENDLEEELEEDLGEETEEDEFSDEEETTPEVDKEEVKEEKGKKKKKKKKDEKSDKDSTKTDTSDEGEEAIEEETEDEFSEEENTPDSE